MFSKVLSNSLFLLLLLMIAAAAVVAVDGVFSCYCYVCLRSRSSCWTENCFISLKYCVTKKMHALYKQKIVPSVIASVYFHTGKEEQEQQHDDDDDDDAGVLCIYTFCYSAVISCYCSMLGALGMVASVEACCQWALLSVQITRLVPLPYY